MRRSVLLEIAERVLPRCQVRLISKGFDVVGDIAVLRVSDKLGNGRFRLAEGLLKALPNVRVVLGQVSPVYGEYRLRRLEWLAGERRTETVHKEYGCLFKVDLARCYFSPRLQYERRRVASLVKPGEVVVNMFAGVGCFSIIIAKHSGASVVYSIDLNPDAYKYMVENIKLNRVEGRVHALLGDAKEVIKRGLLGVADRVLMPLPEKAYEYLEYAVEALKPGVGYIHYYDFVHVDRGEKPIEKVWGKVERRLQELGAPSRLVFGRVVRSVGPRWCQVVLDVEVHKH